MKKKIKNEDDVLTKEQKQEYRNFLDEIYGDVEVAGNLYRTSEIFEALDKEEFEKKTKEYSENN